MRTFQKKNVGTFAIFGVLIVLAIGALSFVVYSSVTTRDNKVSVVAGSYVYTDDDEAIEVSNDCQIVKKWDNNYYLVQDGDTEVLGEHPVIFSSSKGTLQMLGDVYQIFTDGTTQESKNGVTVNEFSDPAMYKLADRKYVFVGRNIYSYDQTFASEDFVRIAIDKNGNALLQSTDINNKTINPIILVCEDVYFDIASEILYSNGVEINMKKVIGSTNEYTDSPILYNDTGIERPATSTANEEVPDIEEYNISAGQGANGGTGGYGGDGGNGGAGGLGGTGGQGADGGNGGTGGDAADPKEDTTFNVALGTVTPGAKQISVNYSVYDQSNALSKIIIRLRKTSNSATSYQDYVVTKYNTNYKIYGLDPNTIYNVEIGYVPYVAHYTDANQTYGSWVNGDYVAVSNVSVRTSTQQATVKLTNVSTITSGNKLVNDSATFNICLSNYNLNYSSSVNVYRFEFYKNNVLQTYKDVSITSNAELTSGQTVKLTNIGNYDRIVLKEIDGTYTDGSSCNITLNYSYSMSVSSAYAKLLSTDTSSAYVGVYTSGYSFDYSTTKIYVDLYDYNGNLISDEGNYYQATSLLGSSTGQTLTISKTIVGATTKYVNKIIVTKIVGTYNNTEYTITLNKEFTISN